MVESANGVSKRARSHKIFRTIWFLTPKTLFHFSNDVGFIIISYFLCTVVYVKTVLKLKLDVGNVNACLNVSIEEERIPCTKLVHGILSSY